MSWYETILNPPSADVGATKHRVAGIAVDRGLFVRFFDGDDSALVALFDRHNHRLYTYCLQFVNNPDHAKDITQELWERLIRLRTEGREYVPTNPMGLLVTMARNRCIDALRTTRRYTGLGDIPEASHPMADAPEMSHLEELVIRALPHLPAPQREVLVLHAYSGYKFEEIAEMLGEPVGAVRTRAWRARAHLGRIISAMVGLEDDSDSKRRIEQWGKNG